MVTTFTQDHRTLTLTTPLGPDKLLLAGFSGTESVSELFHFDLEMWSEDSGITPESLVGKAVGFQVALSDGSFRFFHGMINRFSAGAVRDELRFYRAEVVPHLWFLTRTTDCRIFQSKTAVEIIETVLKEYGLTDFKTAGIKGKPPKREYCVQYRETDFDFLSRLMEEEGIFYYFQHEKSKHTLILADDNSAFVDGGQKEVEHTWSTSDQPRVSRITNWEHRYEFRPGKWAQTDYNFIDKPAATGKTPSKHLLTTADTSLKLTGASKYEKYDFPGPYEKKPDGTTYTKTRMQEEEAGYHQVVGSGRVAPFGAGTKFKIVQHATASENNKTYVLTQVHHRAQEGAPYRGTVGPGEIVDDYENRFIAIPQEVPYRPQRTTPKPGIHGSQTAVVVGPKGEEIWPDKYGRVKVQFFWDREGVRDEKSSCWVRVQQASAGKGWGTMFIPRVGQEVVISYLEGDPDRPLITGVVYNSDQMPAYALPDEKTKSYIKTNSTKEGEGYNEIRFDDLAGEEQIFMHAQKDIDVRVLNDSREHVINDRHLVVGIDGDDGKVGSQYEQVFQDKELNVKRNQTEHIEGNFTWTVGLGEAEDGGNVDLTTELNKTETIGGNNDFHLTGDQKNLIEGNVSTTIGGDRTEEVTGDASLAVVGARSAEIGSDDSLGVAGNILQSAGGGLSLETGADLDQKIGGNAALDAATNVHIKGGTAVVIEAGSQLTLKVGGNFVVIDASGVSVKGAMVNLNSGGAAGSGDGASPTAPQEPAAPETPEDAELAKPTVPDEADDSTTGMKSAPDSLS